MSTKTRKIVEVFERTVKASLRAVATGTAGLYFGTTEVFRFTASAITALVAVTFNAAVTFASTVTFSGAVTFSAGTLRGVVAIPDAATYVVLAANSGKVHVMPNFTASCTIDLPAVADGLNYKFIYGGAAADAQNAIIDTTSDTNFFKGGVMFADHDSADAEIAPVFSDGNSNSILTIITPAVGTEIDVYCDGTNWYLNGTVCSATVPTLGDQA